jgi:3-deoxy-manno-octulosonate cytidylyltransferase (CMP-KDO synthetase)
MTKPRVAGIIPARYGSTRLPGKPLKKILGKSMIQRVYEQCAAAKLLDEVCVATDDARIESAVRQFGGRVVMTRADHLSGTDRLAEAATALDADIVVNIQGDQPFIDPMMIGEAVQPVIDDPSVDLATLMVRSADDAHLKNPAVVKVVVDRLGNALYFSRSLIPYPRESVEHSVFEHVGLYVYRRQTLFHVAGLAPTRLEQAESLEQLRWLEHGLKIRVVETSGEDRAFRGFSVDTPADLVQAEKLLLDRRQR